MTFFRVRWIRRLMRKALPNMEQSVAEKWHKRFTYLYFFSAWNALGYSIYLWKRGKTNFTETGLQTEQEASRSKAIVAMEMLGVPKARVVTVEGFTKVRDEDVVNKALQEEMEHYNQELKDNIAKKSEALRDTI